MPNSARYKYTGSTLVITLSVVTKIIQKRYKVKKLKSDNTFDALRVTFKKVIT
jgi:hypothetical protein